MELEFFHMTTGGSHRSGKTDSSQDCDMTHWWSNTSMDTGGSYRKANIKKRDPCDLTTRGQTFLFAKSQAQSTKTTHTNSCLNTTNETDVTKEIRLSQSRLSRPSGNRKKRVNELVSCVCQLSIYVKASF